MSSIASVAVLRKSLRLIGSSPRSSRWALMIMRRYFVTVTPGMATGYWKAMNSPARARSSVSASVMSSPLKWIVPSVTSRFGWPMITFASVDLPEPFGPMRAWISPSRTVRSRPLRICLSPAEAWRFLISRSGMGSDLDQLLGFTVGEGDELGQRRALQRLDHAALDAHPEQLRGAELAVVVVRAQHLAALADVVDEAGHRRHRALERADHLVHADVLGLPREPVAPVRAAGGLDEAGLL